MHVCAGRPCGSPAAAFACRPTPRRDGSRSRRPRVPACGGAPMTDSSPTCRRLRADPRLRGHRRWQDGCADRPRRLDRLAVPAQSRLAQRVRGTARRTAGRPVSCWPPPAPLGWSAGTCQGTNVLETTFRTSDGAAPGDRRPHPAGGRAATPARAGTPGGGDLRRRADGLAVRAAIRLWQGGPPDRAPAARPDRDQRRRGAGGAPRDAGRPAGSRALRRGPSSPSARAAAP